MKVSGARKLAYWLWVVLCTLDAGCETVPETEVLVVVDADPAVRAQLVQLLVRVLNREGTQQLREQAIFFMGDPGVRVPILVSMLAPSQDSVRDFRVTVTGQGSSAEGALIDVVEQQAVVGFRPGKRQRLDLYLGAGCVSVLCRDGRDETCDLATGQCGQVPVRLDLPPALGDDRVSLPGDGLAAEEGRADAPSESDTSSAVPAGASIDAVMAQDTGPGIEPRDSGNAMVDGQMTMGVSGTDARPTMGGATAGDYDPEGGDEVDAGSTTGGLPAGLIGGANGDNAGGSAGGSEVDAGSTTGGLSGGLIGGASGDSTTGELPAGLIGGAG